MMGLPALLAHYLFRLHKIFVRHREPHSRAVRVWAGVFAFLGGALGLGIAAVIALVLLVTTIPAHLDAAAERASLFALTLAHAPLMALEGLFTVLVVLFLLRVRPELVEGR
jgi:cobalt/nickel transport system permease protein